MNWQLSFHWRINCVQIADFTGFVGQTINPLSRFSKEMAGCRLSLIAPIPEVHLL